MSVNIATTDTKEAPLSVPVGGGEKAPITETAAQTLGGTAGKTEYPFKIALPFVTMSNGETPTEAGTLLTSISLDGKFDDNALQALMTKFMFWRLRAIVLVLKCISPWSTASGTAQVFYNLDPENPPSSSSKPEALALGVRLLRSQQVAAKTDLVTEILPHELDNLVTPAGWRWCKPAASPYPRLERYGTLSVMVRGTPTLGDGSTWAATLEGMVELSHATRNSSAAAFRVPISITSPNYNASIIINGPAIDLLLKTTATLMDNTSGDFNLVSTNPLRLTIQEDGAVGDDDPKEDYILYPSSGVYTDDGSKPVSIVFPTLIGSRTQFANPIVTHFEQQDMSAQLVYYLPEKTFTNMQGSTHLSEIMALPIGTVGQPAYMRVTEAVRRGLQKFVTRAGNMKFIERNGMIMDG